MEVDNAAVLGIAIHAIVIQLLVIGAFLRVIIRLQSIFGALSSHKRVLLRIAVPRILRVADNPVAVLMLLISTYLVLRLALRESLSVGVLGILAHNLLLFNEIFASRHLIRFNNFDLLNIYFLSRLIVVPRPGRGRLVDPTLVLDALQLSLLGIST